MPDIVYPTSGIAIIFFAFILAYRTIRKELKAQDERIESQDTRIADLEEENHVCNYRLELLVSAMRKAKVPVPATLWGPPPWETPHAS